jgi:steroid 5-alpha reductase family enzyme
MRSLWGAGILLFASLLSASLIVIPQFEATWTLLLFFCLAGTLWLGAQWDKTLGLIDTVRILAYGVSFLVFTIIALTLEGAGSVVANVLLCVLMCLYSPIMPKRPKLQWRLRAMGLSPGRNSYRFNVSR